MTATPTSTTTAPEPLSTTPATATAEPRPARVTVLGSSTVRGLVGALEAGLRRHGFAPDVRVGGFGSWGLELRTAPAELFEPTPDLVLVVLDHTVVTDRLPLPWTVDDLDRAWAEAAEDLWAAVDAVDHPVLVTAPVTPRELLAQLVDLASRARAAAIWHRHVADLLDRSAASAHVSALDLSTVLTATGPLRDPRLAAYASMELSAEVLDAVADHAVNVVRTLAGRSRKVLALDLDGTLWGGILAEDGPDGLVMGDGVRGRAFTAFQRVLRQLAAQGVLLTVVSKNDPEEVAAVLAADERLAVRADDMVAVRANWEPKPGNLRAMAESLSLGVDAFVFVDDSASERGLMTQAEPSVAVVAVDADEPAAHPGALLAGDWFLTTTLTDDDRARGERYRGQARRDDLRRASADPDQYLAALGTEVHLAEATAGDVARVAQLTRRTNQFNLMTLRMDEAEVGRWSDDPDRLVLTVRCADRFGDHGLVGAVFCTREAGEVHVRNLVMSCRVLGRGVETAVLASVIGRARSAGATRVVGWYRPSPRNGGVADLYPRHAFTAATEVEEGAGSAMDGGVVTDGNGASAFTFDTAAAPVTTPHVRVHEETTP